MTALPPIRPARPGETPTIAALIADAFHPLDVAVWLTADPQERRRTMTAQFALLIDHAHTHGSVEVLDDLTAAAVWMHRDRGPVLEPVDYQARLAAITGPLLDRFQTLDELLEQHRPPQPHHHLALLAVTPSRQGRGRGGALLDHHHRLLDDEGVAAHLEASSPTSRRFYLERGYHGEPPFHPPGGPPFWPMWRQPATSRTGDDR
jgi:GNAT superfamily N-acetyltransferase